MFHRISESGILMKGLAIVVSLLLFLQEVCDDLICILCRQFDGGLEFLWWCIVFFIVICVIWLIFEVVWYICVIFMVSCLVWCVFVLWGRHWLFRSVSLELGLSVGVRLAWTLIVTLAYVLLLALLIPQATISRLVISVGALCGGIAFGVVLLDLLVRPLGHSFWA